jgi:hypothetical protein
MRKRDLVWSTALVGTLLVAVVSVALEITGESAFGVRVIESKLGTIAVTTKPGASCQALVALPVRGNRPHKIGEPIIAGSDGTVHWNYAISLPGARGSVSHTVTCTYGGATAISRSQFELAVGDD